MVVQVTWRVVARALDDGEVRAAVEAALSLGGRAAIDVDVILVDDPTLAELHGRFLGDPSVTDVMSFDLTDDQPLGELAGEPVDGLRAAEGQIAPAGPAGEIYVSVDRAIAVAEQRGVPVARELALYLVHGALHLCGMDDHEADERAAMRQAEHAVMGALGYPEDRASHDTE